MSEETMKSGVNSPVMSGNFLKSLFDVNEIISFKNMFSTMLSSPIKGSIEFFEHHDSSKSIRFLAYVALIWVIVTASKALFTYPTEFLNSIVLNITCLLTLLTALTVFYKLSNNDSQNKRTPHEFLTISSFNLGIGITLTLLVSYLSLISPFVGLVLITGIFIKFGRQLIKVLEYFWNLSTAKLLLNFAIGIYAGLLSGFIFLGLCSSLFGIQLT